MNFQSTVIEVALGMVFCFASVALIVSSVREAVATALGTRSTTLKEQLVKLLNADSSEGEQLLVQIYNHALVNPLGNGQAQQLTDLKQLPSYIDSRHFAQALLEAVGKAQDQAQDIEQAIAKLPNPQLRELLQGMYAKVDGKAEHLQSEVAHWFDNAMDRASGAYKRDAQRWTFLFAFVLAALLNIDSIHLFKTLWQQPALMSVVALDPASLQYLQGTGAAGAGTGPSTPIMKEAFQNLTALPVGWTLEQWQFDCTQWSSYWAWISRFFGWLITATAALFGAPFWFDLLQNLVKIRGTGSKPVKASESAK